MISVARAAEEFKLLEAALFKYLRQGKLKRWRRTGDSGRSWSVRS